jgi:hypothetical protein
MWNDPIVRAVMAICSVGGQFLYQAAPNLFPYDYPTDLELTLWGRFYDERDKALKSK